MKTLTEKQIDALYLFTQQKGIRYYEVQIELVDHLASAIEREWENNPEISFEQALALVYSRFGIWGFDEIENKKAHALNMLHFQRWSRTFLSFFKLPLAIYTVLIFLLLREIINLVSFDAFYQPYTGVLIAGSLVYMILLYRRKKQKQRKKLMLLNFGRAFSLAFNLTWYIHFFILQHLHFPESWVPALVYTALTVLMLSFIQTSEAIQKQAEKLYPGAFA